MNGTGRLIMHVEQLIQEYGTYIYNYALKLSCHPEDAKDLAQETFIQAWKNLANLKTEKAVKKWLVKICYHQFLMKIRQTGRQNEELIKDYDMLEQEGALLADNSASFSNEIVLQIL